MGTDVRGGGITATCAADTGQTGVVTALAELPPDAVIDAAALAQMFGKCRKSIQRAVGRGELPAPATMFGKAVWTAAAVREHLARRQAEAIRLAARHEAARANDSI